MSVRAWAQEVTCFDTVTQWAAWEQTSSDNGPPPPRGLALLAVLPHSPRVKLPNASGDSLAGGGTRTVGCRSLPSEVGKSRLRLTQRFRARRDNGVCVRTLGMVEVLVVVGLT